MVPSPKSEFFPALRLASPYHCAIAAPIALVFAPDRAESLGYSHSIVPGGLEVMS